MKASFHVKNFQHKSNFYFADPSRQKNLHSSMVNNQYIKSSYKHTVKGTKNKHAAACKRYKIDKTAMPMTDSKA